MPRNTRNTRKVKQRDASGIAIWTAGTVLSFAVKPSPLPCAVRRRRAPSPCAVANCWLLVASCHVVNQLPVVALSDGFAFRRLPFVVATCQLPVASCHVVNQLPVVGLSDGYAVAVRRTPSPLPCAVAVASCHVVNQLPVVELSDGRAVCRSISNAKSNISNPPPPAFLLPAARARRIILMFVSSGY